ncbi:type 1 glutamine amidotransferase family protein [Streptomyces sp. 7R007]
MSSHTFLIGGGWDATAASDVYGPFLRAASAPAPRVGVVVLDEGDGAEQFGRYDAVLRKVADCTPVPLLVPLGDRFDAGLVAGLDGLLVCGGLTPAYQEAFADGRLASVVTDSGIPYAGFSAGAALAARRAVVGGWLDGGVPVCPDFAAEDLEEVEVRDGLGLVPFTVDVHAAQWGTLTRLVTAVGRHRLAGGIAVDENTLVAVDPDGRARVAGRGRAHAVRLGADGEVLVRSYGTGEEIALGA